jgi:hypothetical protein
MDRVLWMCAALALVPAAPLAQGAQRAQPPGEAAAATQPPAPPKGDAAAKPTAPGAPGAAKGAPQGAPAKEGAAPTAKGLPAVSPPGARDLAKALTSEESWNSILDGYAQSLSGQISGALAATGKEAPPDLREKVKKELHEAVRYDEAVEMQARALAGRFSEGELREIEKFYESGAGRKLLGELPSIAAQVNDELRVRLSERVPKIVEKYAPSLAAAPDGEEKGSAGSAAPPDATEKPEAPPPKKP